MYKDLKNNIINTSYQLFMENGYDQTTVNDICKACSITKTTFYRYIDSKEELLSYFFDDINERIDELRTTLPLPSTPFWVIKIMFNKSLMLLI